MCASSAPPSDKLGAERIGPPEQPLDLDQLYAAYAAAHLSIAWAAFVLDYVVDRRDELLERYDTGDDPGRGPDDHGDRRRRVIEWLRTLPAPPTNRPAAESRAGVRASKAFDSHEGGSPCAARS
jgi:hypothetical protein